MNDRTLDQILQAWLDVGPDVAPDHLHEAVAQEARDTRQAAASWRRWIGDSVMSPSTVANIALAAAATALVLVVGLGLMTLGRPVPGTTNLSTSPSPQPTTRSGVDSNDADYSIGRHYLTVEGRPLSLEIPSPGWEPYGELLIAKSEAGSQGAEAIIYWTHYNWMTEHGETDAVACGPWANQPDISVDRLVAQMSTDPGVDLVEASSDVTVGGRSAKHLVVTVAADLGCDPGYFFNWRAQTGGALWQMSSVGDTLRVWIVDDSPEPFFIVAATNAEASQSLAQEVQQIVESVSFD